MIRFFKETGKYTGVLLALLLHFSLQAQPERPPRVIHVMVALCDNASQGIAPVPPLIGDGDDPFNNLYWGCGYGVKTFFRKSPNWQLVREQKRPHADEVVLERLVFRHRKKNAYLVADAYRGREIKTALNDFLDALNGVKGEDISVSGVSLRIGGYADMLAYVGHNGLMEFSLPEVRRKNIYKKREGVVLACSSTDYFENHFKLSEAHPLLQTTDLMAPEAYTLEAVIEEWLKPEHTRESIHRAAARTYQKYQKCSLRGAENLFQSGW